MGRVGAVRLRRGADVGRSPGPERSGRGRLSGGSRQQGVGNSRAPTACMAAAGGHEDLRGEDGEVYHRDNIFEFFRNHTAYDMLPESGKVRPRALLASGALATVCVTGPPHGGCVSAFDGAPHDVSVSMSVAVSVSVSVSESISVSVSFSVCLCLSVSVCVCVCVCVFVAVPSAGDPNGFDHISIQRLQPDGRQRTAVCACVGQPG